MKSLIVSGTLMLALAAPLVVAESSSSQTSTYSTTTKSVPTNPSYSSTRTEQQLDEHGNVIKKSETYNSTDSATGDSSARSSTTTTGPDGVQSTVEQARVRSNADGGTSVTEKRTTTTTQ